MKIKEEKERDSVTIEYLLKINERVILFDAYFEIKFIYIINQNSIEASIDFHFEER